MGNSLVTGEFPAQRPVTQSFMFPLIFNWINSCGNNREAGDLKRHHAHYDVTVMIVGDLDQYHGCWGPVVSFTKEVNWRLAKRSLKTNGRLANRQLTSLVKEATDILVTCIARAPATWYWLCRITRSCPSTRRDFKYLCHFNVDENDRKTTVQLYLLRKFEHDKSNLLIY